MKVRKTLIIECSFENPHCPPEVEVALRKHKIDYSVHNRAELDSSLFDADLVLSLGGDGTFLRTSHYNDKTPQFGVNPYPKDKEGFFTRATCPDFEKKFDLLMAGKSKVGKLLRLEASINGTPVEELALNEFYIGPRKPYGLFNYELEVDGKKEFQRSSGLLLSTPAGSYAWAKSAGGEVLPLYGDVFQLIAREPYARTLHKPAMMTKMILAHDSVVRVKAKSFFGLLVADSVSEEHEFNEDDVVEIKVSEKPLLFVDF